MAIPPAGTSSPKLVGVGVPLPLVLVGPLLSLPVALPVSLLFSVLPSSPLVVVGLSLLDESPVDFGASVVFGCVEEGSADSESE
jgi:hypothetical protein